MKRFVMLAALFAAACQPIPADGGKVELAPVPAAEAAAQTPADAASACAARGGKMLPQGRMQSLQCVVSYTDGGTRCTDGDQCQGSCRIADVTNAPRAGAAAIIERMAGSPFC